MHCTNILAGVVWHGTFVFPLFLFSLLFCSTAKRGILASSDVSARGMDYPDVSFVLQMGSTVREQYIHRLGRTARAGKGGSGLLLLAPFEYHNMVRGELPDLPLEETTEAEVQALIRTPPSVMVSVVRYGAV